MSTSIAARRGPQPAATPEQVLDLAADMLLRGALPEMAALADRSGVGRTTLYRWFGDRDTLIGEVLSRYLETMLEQGYRRARTHGGRRVASAIETLNRDAAAREPFLRLLHAQPQVMLNIVMNPDGSVQARSIATVQELIDREQHAGRYRPILDARSLAFILVQIGQSFMWARAATGAPPDVDETMRVTDALLRAELDPKADLAHDRN
jgi:AcrR family transcriptional regulator